MPQAGIGPFFLLGWLLCAKHLQAYLDEFVFRFKRRRTRHAAFQSLLGLAANAQPATYKMLIAPETNG